VNVVTHYLVELEGEGEHRTPRSAERINGNVM